MKNQTKTLMLGDIDIGQYVEIPNIEDKRLEEVKAKVSELKNNCLDSEKIIYNELYSEMISREYPRIDLNFLEKSYDKNTSIATGGFPGNHQLNIKVPAFSVYPFYGENEFNIILPCLSSDIYLSLPAIILNPIFKNLMQQKDNYRIKLTSTFNGLIPQKVKEKVKKSLEHFHKEDIYLVAETKPKEWNVEQIKRSPDPLVIGLIGDKNVHLIDHFDLTPLENLVKDVYIQNKLN